MFDVVLEGMCSLGGCSEAAVRHLPPYIHNQHNAVVVNFILRSVGLRLRVGEGHTGVSSEEVREGRGDKQKYKEAFDFRDCGYVLV